MDRLEARLEDLEPAQRPVVDDRYTPQEAERVKREILAKRPGPSSAPRPSGAQALFVRGGLRGADPPEPPKAEPVAVGRAGARQDERRRPSSEAHAAVERPASPEAAGDRQPTRPSPTTGGSCEPKGRQNGRRQYPARGTHGRDQEVARALEDVGGCAGVRRASSSAPSCPRRQASRRTPRKAASILIGRRRGVAAR